MNSKYIFIGNIYNQTNPGIIKRAILIKAVNEKFLELENYNLKTHLGLFIPALQTEAFISTNPKENQTNIFVDNKSLEPYISKQTNLSLTRVKKIHKKK